MNSAAQPIKAIAHQLFQEFMPIAMLLRQTQCPPDEVIEQQYLVRWWLAKIAAQHDHATLGPLKEHTRETTGFNLYLHRMTGSDKRVMHDHPWPNASLILEGEVIEHNLLGSYRRRPGELVYRRAEEFHRLELAGPVCWTLFLTGQKVQEWGFLQPNGKKAHWKEVSAIGPDGIQRYTGPEYAPGTAPQ